MSKYEKKSFGDKGGFERKSFGSQNSFGDKKSFGGDRKSFGDKKSFGGDRKSFGDKKSFSGDRKSFSGDRKTFSGDKKSFSGDRKSFGDKKPFSKKPEQPKSYTREERKKLRKDRKLAKPNAAEATEVNKIFGSNLQELTKQERVDAASRTVKAANGKVLQLCRRHDTARALQLVFKYGNKSVRDLAWSEIKGHIVELTRSKTGHFVILSMAKHFNTIHAEMIAELKGSCRSLATNKDGAQLLDFLYASSPPQLQYLILRELLDPTFAVFSTNANKQIDQHLQHTRKQQEEVKNRYLNEIMEQIPNIHEISLYTDEQIASKPQFLLAWLVSRDPANRCVLYDKIELFLQRALDKDCLMFRFFHPILLQYLQVVPITISTKRHLMIQVARAPLNLWHSKEGAQSAFIVLNYLSLKDRKAFIKSLKGRILEMALSDTGYLLILALLHTVDDTVALKKQVLNEIFTKGDTANLGQPPPMSQLLTSLPGMKILSYIFNPSLNQKDFAFFSTKWYTQSELELFKPVYVPKYLLEADARAEKEKEKEEKEDAALDAKLAAEAAGGGNTDAPVAPIKDLDANGKEKMTDKEYEQMMKQSEVTRLAQKTEESKSISNKTGIDTTPTRTFKKAYEAKAYDLGLHCGPILMEFLETTKISELFGFEERGNLQRSNIALIAAEDDSDSDSSDSDSDSDSDSRDSDSSDSDSGSDGEAVDDIKKDPKIEQARVSIQAKQKSFQFRDQLNELSQKESILEAFSKHRNAIEILFQIFSSLSLRAMDIEKLPMKLEQIKENVSDVLIDTHPKYSQQYSKLIPRLESLLDVLATIVSTVHGYTTVQSHDAEITKATFKKQQNEISEDQLLFTTANGLEFHQVDHILVNGKSHLLLKRLVSDLSHDPADEYNPFNINGLAPEQRNKFATKVYQEVLKLMEKNPKLFSELKLQNRFAFVLSSLLYNNPKLSIAPFKNSIINPKDKKLSPGMELLKKVLNGEKISQTINQHQQQQQRAQLVKSSEKKTMNDKDVNNVKKGGDDDVAAVVKPGTPSKRKAAPKKTKEEEQEEVIEQPIKRATRATTRSTTKLA
jgi:hypothetical protein